MKRRRFITLLGGTAAMWPLAARAQQPSKLPTIGFLGQSTPVIESRRVAAFLQRSRELGWIEGRTIAIEYAWGQGSSERFAEIAADFVRLKVDVIVTSGTANVIAAKRATSVIPIVFAVAGDPIANNLVTSLARPGGNVTGLSTVATDLAGKRLELLTEAVSDFRRLATIGNASNSLSVLEMREVKAAASRFWPGRDLPGSPASTGYRACDRGAQRCRRCSLRGCRSPHKYEPRPNPQIGYGSATAGDL